MRWLWLSLMLALCWAALVRADDAGEIAYGDLVKGEISVRDYEALYCFEGEAGDVVKIFLKPANDSYSWSGWYHPALLLLNADGDVIAELHSYDSAAMIQALPATGRYQIIATGWHGRTRDEVGAFDLSLEALAELKPGEALAGAASTDESQHYVVQADRDFSITYRLTDGDFRPEVSVGVIAEDPYQCSIDSTSCSSDSGGSNLHDVAKLSGVRLQSGRLSARVNSSAAEVYIVEVDKQEWYHYERKQTAEFTLELTFDEP
ncbi:MAG: hypothetical protein OXE46_04815 [Chloroflexi bacterium]|nr:hypothetical protein [Chloroflexota bacterium]